MEKREGQGMWLCTESREEFCCAGPGLPSQRPCVKQLMSLVSCDCHLEGWLSMQGYCKGCLLSAIPMRTKVLEMLQKQPIFPFHLILRECKEKGCLVAVPGAAATGCDIVLHDHHVPSLLGRTLQPTLSRGHGWEAATWC